jgi:hypothetical protein
MICDKARGNNALKGVSRIAAIAKIKMLPCNLDVNIAAIETSLAKPALAVGQCREGEEVR